MNQNQHRALELLRTNPARDLYEVASSVTLRHGAGRFAITYTATENYEYLTTAEVNELVSAGLLQDKWPNARHKSERGDSGFFVLASAGAGKGE